MKKRIENYRDRLNQVTLDIKQDLSEYFKNFDYSISSSAFQIITLKSDEDFEKIYSGSGFYLILTDKQFENNECTFSIKEQTAIYRGHSCYTKKRILSHLSNDRYKSQRKPNEPKYDVCLKIEDGVNGININQTPYKNWNWIVVVHKMRHSTKLIREQAEYAFDSAHGKPCKSREVNS